MTALNEIIIDFKNEIKACQIELNTKISGSRRNQLIKEIIKYKTIINNIYKLYKKSF